MFNATLVVCRNPFRPHLGREVTVLRRRVRLDTVLRHQGMISGRGRTMRRLHTFMPLVNGSPVLERDWGRPVRDGDVVVLAALPQGGGGGSNPLQMILQLAVVAAALIIPGMQPWAFVLGTWQFGLTSAAIMLAGTFLVNALVPPTRAPSSLGAQQASPTYTIGAQGNAARLQNPIPVLYGRYRSYPDFASQPYVENHGNEQYLYQLFCISQGEVAVEKVMIGDTDISSYAEVQYEIVPPGGAMVLFPDNVVTSSDVTGIELKGPNEGGDWIGPFVASAGGTKANFIGIDFSLPSGLFRADDDGNPAAMSVSYHVQCQLVDDRGNPIGPWLDLANASVSMATIQPQMLSQRYAVAPGRYQVRVRRTSDKSTDTRTANTLQWSGMRAYLPSQRYYGDVTLLAMVIRATNNLNSQTAKKINVIATRKLPVWNGASWSAPQVTRNPAWALADVIRNTTYGRGLADNRLNLDTLLTLSATWDARGDTFDGVFDTAATVWDVLTQIASVGNATPVYYAGVIDFVRDEKRTIRTAMFAPSNIIQNSLQIEYAFQSYDTPDHVVVQYTDDTTFQPAEVPCVLAGGTQLKPARLQLFGCTNRAQAWRWGMRQAAANRDRRRNITLTTEMEGYIPRYGDLVSVSHDVPAWGLSGVVLNYTAGVITTSEPLDWTAGKTHYMAFRRRDGSGDGPYVVTAGQDEFTAIVAGSPALYISDGISEEPTQYQFGPGERHGLDCQVLSVSPKDDGQVELALVNYAESVFEAENSGDVPPPPPASLLPEISDAPVVASVSVIGSPQNGLSVISCTPARGATSYEFQASANSGAAWTPLGMSLSPTINANLGAGLWQVRARAIGSLAGPWAVWSGAINAITYPPAAPTLTLQNPPFNGGAMRVNVSNAKGDYRNVRVITGGVVRLEYDTTNYVIDWDIAAARANGAVSPVVTFQVAEYNAVGPSPAASITVTKQPPPAPTGAYDSSLALVRINAVSALDIDQYWIREAASGAIVYRGASPGSAPASAGATYYLSVTDQWGNTSSVTTVKAT